MRRIAVIVTARPSWSKLQTICEAVQSHPALDLQIVVCASALLERYGRVRDVIAAQFPIAAEVWSTYEGATLLTGAKETGALLGDLADVLSRLRPDVVLVCADRHEVLGAAQAACYLHLPLAHVQGGERSGSLDDRVRDAITALADVHYPCTPAAAARVRLITPSPHVYLTGCSSIDLARRAVDAPAVTASELGGAGVPVDLSQPFGLVLQHPVTLEADQAYAQMTTMLQAIQQIVTPGPWVVLWPGEDAGAEGASKAIREHQPWLHTVRNLPPARFLRLLTQAAVLVGNSSAGIREGSYLGVPVVNIGTRQQGRERAANVMDAPHDAGAIAAAIQRQVAHGPYPSSTLYGTGHSGAQIAERLATWDASLR